MIHVIHCSWPWSWKSAIQSWWILKFQRQRKGGRGFEPICQVCGKVGHTALKCYHRFDMSFQGGETSNNQQQQHVPQQQHGSTSQACVVTPRTVLDSAWYIDSGATSHVTAKLDILTIQNDYKGKEKLTVGNVSQLNISHIGSTSILLKPNFRNSNFLKSSLNFFFAFHGVFGVKEIREFMVQRQELPLWSVNMGY